MPAYRYWAFDLVSKASFGQLPLQQATLTSIINTPGQFQATLYPQSVIPESWGLNDPRTTARLAALKNSIECGKTLIVAEYDNTIAGSAIVWQYTYNSEQDGQPANYSIQGAEVLSYFNQRMNRGATGLATDGINSGFPSDLGTGTDQVSGTLAYLINYCQTVNGIGIDTSKLTPSGVSNQESYDPTKRDPILTLINNLTQTIGGPDVWIDTEWVAPGVKTPKLYAIGGYPKIGIQWDGTRAGLRKLPHFRYPGNILYYTESRDATQMATVVDELSRDSSGNTDIASATNAGLSTYGKWPQLDYANSRDGGEAAAISQATLQAYANADALTYNGPLDLLTIVMRPQDVIGVVHPGDYLWSTITDWNYPGTADVVQRCLGIQYDFDNQTATIQLDTNDSSSASDVVLS